MLEVSGISKKIDKLILEDISFKVKHGEYFVLLGKSGVGKTMLLEIIAGLVTPDSGQILLDGCDITKEQLINIPASGAIINRSTSPPIARKEISSMSSFFDLEIRGILLCCIFFQNLWQFVVGIR